MHWVSCWSVKHQNLSYHQNLLSGQTYPAPRPDFRDLTQICPAPNQNMSGLLALSRFQRPNPDMFGPQSGHVWPLSLIWLLNRVPEMVARHVRASMRTCLGFWHPTARFPSGAIKGPHASLVGLATQFNLQTLWDTLLSSQPLSFKLHSNPSFLWEIWASLLSDPLDLQLNHFTNNLCVFVTLGDSFP
jgi:hypothetical protein